MKEDESAINVTDKVSDLLNQHGAIFIDLENLFYCRRTAFREERPGEIYDASQLTADVQLLSQWMSAQFRGFVVNTRRGYANFSAGFAVIDPTTNSEITKISPYKELMELGVEPISVFGRGKGKNSVDMRIATDMVSLCSSHSPIKRILLIAGDSDYLPVILELRRVGIEMLVVGFRGAKEKPAVVNFFPKFADQFWYFEDLVREQEHKIHEQAEKREPHSAGYYKLVLQDQVPRYFIVSAQDWNDITDAIFEEVGTGIAKPEDIVSHIQDYLNASASDTSVSVRLVVKQLLDSGCFTRVDSSTPDGVQEWEREVRLAPGTDNAETMRMRAREKIQSTLGERLKGIGDERKLKKEAVAELLFGPKPTADETKLAEHLILKTGE